MKVFAGIGGIDLFLGILLELEQIEVLKALAGAEGIAETLAGTLGRALAGTFAGVLDRAFGGTFDGAFADCFCHRMVL